MVSAHRRHGFYVLVMVVGWVLPPIAVLLRFGFGADFFINIILTLAGYIPGHGHNFYLQNIRNNENRRRTPQWATRAGLVKDPSVKRKRKTQWANRYDERTPTRADGYQDEDLVPNPSTELDQITLSGSNHPTETHIDISRESLNQGNLDLEARDLDRVTCSRPSSRHTSNSYRKSDVDDTNLDRKPLRPLNGSSLSSNSSKPPLRRSLSQKFGLGKKASPKKNRFDRSREARAQWDYVIQEPRRSTLVATDGLEHTF